VLSTVEYLTALFSFVEQVVGKLRKENRKTMVFSLLLMTLGVIVYFGAQSFYAT